MISAGTSTVCPNPNALDTERFSRLYEPITACGIACDASILALFVSLKFGTQTGEEVIRAVGYKRSEGGYTRREKRL